MTFIVKNPHSRVHATTGTRPLCGGGHGGRSVQWQQDIGPSTCKACAKVALGKNTRLSAPPPVGAAAPALRNLTALKHPSPNSHTIL